MLNKNTSIISGKVADILPEYLETCPSCKYTFISPKFHNIAIKKKYIMDAVLNELHSYEDVAKSFKVSRQRVGQIIKEYKKHGY